MGQRCLVTPARRLLWKVVSIAQIHFLKEKLLLSDNNYYLFMVRHSPHSFQSLSYSIIYRWINYRSVSNNQNCGLSTGSVPIHSIIIQYLFITSLHLLLTGSSIQHSASVLPKRTISSRLPPITSRWSCVSVLIIVLA